MNVSRVIKNFSQLSSRCNWNATLGDTSHVLKVVASQCNPIINSGVSCSPIHSLRSTFQSTNLHHVSSQATATENQSSSVSSQHKVQSTLNPFELVKSDLDNLYENIRKSLWTEKSELEEIACYYFDGHGKAFRPMIVVLIARALNHHVSQISELLESQKTVAMATEMIHTASLIHDDVIDIADTRRGKPSVNILWGQKKAILAGTYVLSRASQILARLRDDEVIYVLSKTLMDLVQGEFMQMGAKENETERFKHYIEKSFKKTASLIAYTCKAVAHLSGADPSLQEAAFQYGRNLGIAFQLIDDLLDFVSSQSELGKPTATDLKLGLATAPVLYACKKFPELNAMIMRRFCEPGDVEKAYAAVMESDGLDHTRLLAREHADIALEYIKPFHDSEEKQALIMLAEMTLSRKK
ncbi:all trans-polyprenyl-diphosphate synthase PDSS1-like [Brevipalpus obovatus]|uniref:all trans-polyprenyl-diphosphate synthase PDSS1-like n=1 Tax=Brevipalpus obovatus TaxID=246614 RepID=UPI003D9E8B56